MFTLSVQLSIYRSKMGSLANARLPVLIIARIMLAQAQARLAKS